MDKQEWADKEIADYIYVYVSHHEPPVRCSYI